MRYRIHHSTSLLYDSVVRLARLNLRLKPAPWPGQRVENFALKLDPPPAEIEAGDGPWIVHRHRVILREALSELSIESRFEIEVNEPAPAPEDAPDIASIRAAALALPDLSAMGPASYLFASPMAPPSAAIAEWAAPFFGPDQSVLAAGHALMGAIHAQFSYDGTATSVTTTAKDAFEQKRGVCQDFAHVMIVAARAHGIPAAYVSGYLRTLPPPGQPRLVGADAMHAWAALWCGQDIGWVGFDPTNDVLAGTDHIFVAMGRDYADIAPIDGVFMGGAGQRLSVSVDVEPVED
ncbi:transglutaminase family protein [Novosphingobium sediminicola]|uniref:Transglutaminase-like putative cysteine protease n=1 Tax=Novosphingobium sediminicola TaxID=563162 RepID=A0A7W6CHM3_9SPHN|nr:transglutaminase family protein [Novosphingobium sediminicola]MBB3953196.1 transglutaminase-like putative cysteine protease [Novosphingobium sediminicola]